MGISHFFQKEDMKKLLPYFKPYKKQSVLGPLLKLLEATFELLVPVVVGLIIDKGLGVGVLSDGKTVYPDARKGYIVGLCGVLALFGLVGFAFAVAAQYFAAKTATGVASDVRKDLFKKLQSLSYPDLDKLGTSTMLTRMTGDIDRLQSGVNLFLRLLLRSPFIVFGAMVTAFFIDVKTALVFAGAIPVLALVVAGIMAITTPLHKKSQEQLDLITLSTRENLSGVRVLRAFCKEEQERTAFDEKNRALTRRRFFADGIGAIMNPLTYALVNIAVIILLYTGAIRVNAGNLSQGKVIALYNLMTQILVELIKLANLIVTVSKAFACGNRIEKILQMQPSYMTAGKAMDQDMPPMDGYIVFDNVTLRYNAEADSALENISLRVEKGQTVGVIGGTGSGKTSLVSMIPRFYQAESGRVWIDGKPVECYDAEELRERIVVAEQKAVLFKGTVRENLLWGNSSATDEELFSALKVAQADKFVQEKGGLDAVVEQGGRNFSGGQKQRLALARAIVKKAEILLLDDSFSALDYKTESLVRKAVQSLDYKPTVFVVSQRASSVSGADQIVVLDDGKIVGVGGMDELMASCPTFREIYFSQYEQKEQGGQRA